MDNLNPNKLNLKSTIGNKFVDFFTFYERLDTKAKTGISFYDFWKNKKSYQRKKYIQSLIKYYKKTKASKNEITTWYDAFRLYHSSVSIFKPIIAMEIYNKFKPHTVLDPTMGWGGRLVGACALDVPKYIGFDSNKNLSMGYSGMIKKLKEMGTKTDIQVDFRDALTVDYKKLKYDMVFTSPPYYNIEQYKGQDKKSKDEWDEEFYKPLITKTYEGLSSGGWYILNIPIEVYDRIGKKLLGKPKYKIPLQLVKRKKDTPYKEFIYVWKKQ